MEQERDTQPREEPEREAPPAPRAEEGGISTGRKIRLAVLICILAALTVATLLVKAKQRRQEQQRQEVVSFALAELRQAVEGLDPALAPDILAGRLAKGLFVYDRIRELDPDHREADRLAVALMYAGGHDLQEAVELFNSLDVRAIAGEHAERLAAEGRRHPYAAAERMLTRYPDLRAEAARPEIYAPGTQHLRRSALLWGLTQAALRGDADDVQRALRLCRWMALHVRPEQTAHVAADPYMVVWQGYGSPAETAWAYCELARQAGLRTNVVVPASDEAVASEPLVQVYPADAAPFLVNPFLGVPVTDADSGGLLALEDLPAAGGALGAGPNPGGEHELKVALDPMTCYPRFQAFEYMLAPLPAHPRVAFDFDSLGADRPVELWEEPIKILDQMRTAQYRRDASAAYRPMQPLNSARLLHLQGHCTLAAVLYNAMLADLEQKLGQAEVQEAVAVLREATDDAAFFRALNAYDMMVAAEAESQLRGYLSDRPDGRWRDMASLLLAETLQESGDAEAAAELRRALPEGRRAFGVLRSKGLLAPPPPARTAPTAADEAGPPEPP